MPGVQPGRCGGRTVCGNEIDRVEECQADRAEEAQRGMQARRTQQTSPFEIVHLEDLAEGERVVGLAERAGTCGMHVHVWPRVVVQQGRPRRVVRRRRVR
jgi:hypothetical protein